MKIDTLVFSGASTKFPIYAGIFRALYDSHILTPNLDGIQDIYVCSISMLMIIFVLLGADIDIIEECCMRGKFENLIDIDTIHIDALITEYGLTSNELLKTIVSNYIQQTLGKDDLTLQELYEHNPINLHVKCANITQRRIEYINHSTNPDISVCHLLCMTTAIPVLFKPIMYNDCMYLDGGINSGFPIDKIQNQETYLGIRIKTEKNDSIQSIIDFVYNTMTLRNFKDEELNKERTITYTHTLHFSQFEISEDIKRELIDQGYRQTKQHIDTYQLTNELIKLRPEDKDPIEED